MTWLWIPHASSWSSTYECVGLLRTFHPLLTSRFTFQHLPTFVFCLFCVFCLVLFFVVFWFLFCKCLGIPNSPRSLDLDDRQGLIARSAMQQKKNRSSLLKVQPTDNPGPVGSSQLRGRSFFFFFLVSRTRHHSCAGHCQPTSRPLRCVLPN